MAASLRELAPLILQVSHNAINLFYHSLCQYFDLTANFNCGNRTPGNHIPRHRNCRDMWNDFAKCSVAAASANPDNPVSNVHDALHLIDARI